MDEAVAKVLEVLNCAWSPCSVCAIYGVTTFSVCQMLYLWIKLEFRLKAMSWMTLDTTWGRFFWMGAKVVDWRLLMNYVDVAVQNARANSQVLEDLFAGFGGPLPYFQIAITRIWWMAWTSIYTSEHIALSVPCSAWFLVDAAIGPLRSVEMSKVSAMFFAAMLRFGIMFSRLTSFGNLLRWPSNGWALESSGICPLIFVMCSRWQVTEQLWFGSTVGIWKPLEPNRSGGPASVCILRGPLVWLVTWNRVGLNVPCCMMLLECRSQG